MAVDDHVVQERPLRREETRILRLPDLQLRGIAARNPLHRCQGVFARDFDLAHVADVEDTRARTAMCSLLIPAYSTGMSQPAKGTIFAWEAR